MPLHRFMAEVTKLPAGEADATFFEQEAEAQTSPYRAGVASLLEVRAHDLRGRRREAKAAYRRVADLAGAVDPNLLRRAKDGLSRRFTKKRAQSLLFDTCMADVAN